jgi:hypothetical protein
VEDGDFELPQSFEQGAGRGKRILALSRYQQEVSLQHQLRMVQFFLILKVYFKYYESHILDCCLHTYSSNIMVVFKMERFHRIKYNTANSCSSCIGSYVEGSNHWPFWPLVCTW